MRRGREVQQLDIGYPESSLSLERPTRDGGHFRAAYGVAPGEWILIRPDGYVGAIVSSSEVAVLSAYFNRVGVVTSTATEATAR
jgi:hypothetical protein